MNCIKRVTTITIAIIMVLTSVFATTEIAKADSAEVGAVSKFKASLYSSNKVKLTWSKKSDVDGYLISEKIGNKYKSIKVIRNTNTTSWIAKNVKKGKSHTYAIETFVKGSGEDEYSYSSYVHAKVTVPKLLKQSSKGFSSTTAGKVIKAAKKKLGCRYVSGAAGPNRFDCSGFVYYISKTTKASTKKVSRTSSASMWSKLKKYSIGSKKLSKAQPGDIVFTASTGGSRVSHTGFYYGNGKLIHATNPSQGVRVSSAKYFGKIVGIVRLPNM